MIKHDIDMMLGTVKVFDIFAQCVKAIKGNVLIEQVSNTDKEFHFQNWFYNRVKEIDIALEPVGRNNYPDFKLVDSTESYEIKGLAYPGRDKTFDCNSNPPAGFHKENDVYYVFGRYPKEETDNKEYPIVDLVFCHGQFLNEHHRYLHKNKNVRGFGSFGDIMIRDRKMYVANTPFSLVNGLEGERTLIIPDSLSPSEGFKKVGELMRKEGDQLVVGYKFDLETNDISITKIPNPNAGKEYRFSAYRLECDSNHPVSTNNEIVDISSWVI